MKELWEPECMRHIWQGGVAQDMPLGSSADIFYLHKQFASRIDGIEEMLTNN